METAGQVKGGGVWRGLRGSEFGLALVVVLLALFLTFFSQPVAMPDGREVNGFFRLDNLLGNVLVPMSWIGVMAIGMTAVIIAGGIDISVGSIFALSALAAAGVLQHFKEDASPWLVLPVAVAVPVLVGGLCGLVNGLLVVGLRVHPFIVTLGTLSIFRGVGLIAVPTKTLPSGDGVLPDAFTSGFVQFTRTIDSGGGSVVLLQPVPVIVLALAAVVGGLFLWGTVWGREIYAVGGNEEAARFSGIPVGRVKVRVYVISGLCAGVAGMLSAGFFGSANTATGEGYELVVIAAAVVGGASLTGGRGTALGAILGTLVIRLIENGIDILRAVPLGFVTLTLSKEYSKIIIGVAIVLAVAADRLTQRWRR